MSKMHIQEQGDGAVLPNAELVPLHKLFPLGEVGEIYAATLTSAQEEREPAARAAIEQQSERVSRLMGEFADNLQLHRNAGGRVGGSLATLLIQAGMVHLLEEDEWPRGGNPAPLAASDKAGPDDGTTNLANQQEAENEQGAENKSGCQADKDEDENNETAKVVLDNETTGRAPSKVGGTDSNERWEAAPNQPVAPPTACLPAPASPASHSQPKEHAVVVAANSNQRPTTAVAEPAPDKIGEMLAQISKMRAK